MAVNNHDDGFTLVELMTVVLVISALVSIAIPVFTSASTRAASSACLANQVMAARAAEMYRSRENTSPPTLQSMVGSRFFLKLPTCPSKGTYVWLSRRSAGDDSLACSVHYISLDSPLWTTSWSNLDGFKTTMGSWTNANGVLNASTSTYQNRGLFGSTAWGDVRISANATLRSGAGYGVYFRATEGPAGPTGYCFQYDPGASDRFLVRKVVNGKETTTVATALMPKGFAIYGTSHNIEITAIGSHIVAKVDGVVVLDFIDSSYASGQAGLRTWSKADAGFGSVNVYKATP